MKRNLGEPVELWDPSCVQLMNRLGSRGQVGFCAVLWYKIYFSIYDRLRDSHNASVRVGLRDSLEDYARSP